MSSRLSVFRRLYGATGTTPAASRCSYQPRMSYVLSPSIHLGLSTVSALCMTLLALPEAEDGYQRQYLDSDHWSVTESTLTARDGDYFCTSASADPRPTLSETPPRTERFSGLTSVLKTPPSPAQHDSSMGANSHITSASSRKSVQDSNREAREAPTERSNNQVDANYDTFVTWFTKRRTRLWMKHFNTSAT